MRSAGSEPPLQQQQQQHRPPFHRCCCQGCLVFNRGSHKHTHSSLTGLALPTAGRQDEPVEVELSCVCVCVCVVFVVFFSLPPRGPPPESSMF